MCNNECNYYYIIVKYPYINKTRYLLFKKIYINGLKTIVIMQG